MSIDIFVLIIVGVFFFKGYTRGVIGAFFGAAAMLLGIVVALTLSKKVSMWLLHQGWVGSGWAPIVSYILLFTLVVWLVKMMGNALDGLLSSMSLGIVNKMLGGLLYAFIGAVLASVLLWLAGQMHLFSAPTLQQATTYPYITPLAPWIFARAGQVIPLLKDVFSDLRLFFEQVNQSIPSDVGAH